MPVFTTPDPISLRIDLSVGDVRIAASDRTDTVVEVRPSNASDDSDVRAAQRTRVEFVDGTLSVRGPRTLDLSRRTHSVAVLVELPTGSTVRGEMAAGDVGSTGVLGEYRFTTSAGHFHLGRTGRLRLDTTGHVTVERVVGDAEVATGSGRVRISEIDGAAVVENANGPTDLGTVTGALRVRSSNGDISVGRAEAAVDAKTSNGTIRIGEVARDAVTVRTSAGDLEIGVAAGSAARFTLKTGHGRVQNAIEPAPGHTLDIRAHTGFGDITVRRSSEGN
ncbi:DUF4097 family beta strand repeat-containing protein [Virgisporangium ochraceum]|uniref:DUF4097 domain-containing protein n=1 Tax=Virgisporangium ochraceum TaxID=65505 RepID=A0A8J4EHM4_9ACTN|nr:DUF4097 family beta strand repeat-containing protein [Virgisporangium ochraceum]GIJ74878.1 hypothetical protein Voc01_097950 [Virgisporangium ochraceum]